MDLVALLTRVVQLKSDELAAQERTIEDLRERLARVERVLAER